MESELCITCKGNDFLEFRSEGDIVCRNCGTVKEARLIDERSEWRTFSDKDKDTTDPNRVGGPTSHLLEGLTTTIGRERNDGGLSYTLNRIHARTNNPDRALVAAFKEVGRMCELLKCNASVKDRACEIYKEVVQAKSLKGRSVKALAASCLFWACRQEKQARTFKEIVTALGNDVSKKEIGRCFKDLQQLKKDELHLQGAASDALASTMNQTVQHPAEFVIRKEAAESRAAGGSGGGGGGGGSYGGGGRSLKAVADQSLQRVALISSVAEATIRGAYKDIYPYIPSLLPPGFATAEEIARLPNPDSRNVGPLMPAGPPQQQAAQLQQGLQLQQAMQLQQGLQLQQAMQMQQAMQLKQGMQLQQPQQQGAYM
ncbi:Transcription initiation factor IIB [Tetrabaena socialis]|uniref:General transcription factor TFIIB n=1 Tax=Tetrabaena socialis TaxID=47790 RepID=A0A2J7ZSB8_9CHLO|nr:Transcription initiation factor IIB [Tetrabaena socialis]|eukprot:PNH03130.1 Transcription initiation factor IIB [Tetrabaena socialis]